MRKRHNACYSNVDRHLLVAVADVFVGGGVVAFVFVGQKNARIHTRTHTHAHTHKPLQPFSPSLS